MGKICKSKKKGGLGIRKKNERLWKWWWKLEKEEGLCQQIVKYKYMQNKSIHTVDHRINDSFMWVDLRNVNIFIFKEGELLLKMGL